MTMLHSRCESIEAMLRGRIGDLEAQLSEAHDQLLEMGKDAAERERGLVDRIIALKDPTALRALQPAAPAPLLQRAGSRPIPRPGSAMPMSPSSAGFRPATRSAQPPPTIAEHLAADAAGGVEIPAERT